MLGNDRFAFETPNVIDPGDLPPSAPKREEGGEGRSKDGGNSHTLSTHSNSSSAEDYQETRESTRRLLNDINDLDLSPSEPYDPYADDEDDDDDDDAEYGRSHSLPSVEEARTYAAALLTTTKTSSRKKAPFGRTVQIDAPASRHLVRKRILRMAGRAAILIAGLALLITIVALAGRNKGNQSSSSSAAHSDATARLTYINDFLVKSRISTRDDLETDGSPQYLAAEWIAKKDKTIPALPRNLIKDYHFVQRYVLAVLYFSTNGPDWNRTADFLSEQHECSWNAQEFYEQLIEKDMALGVSCDVAKLEVRDIYLPDNELKGSLPSEMQYLSHLRLLSFFNNDIAGTIPEDFKRLSHLTFLDLRYNELKGTVPEWVAQHIQGLEVLGLSNNQMEGSIPTNFANLQQLHTLTLDDNQFTGKLQFANDLTKLMYFYADRNQFTDTIQADFLDQLDVLHVLDLSSNQLTGKEWPAHLFHHPTLHVLDWSNNKFQATLPEVIERNDQLEYLSLRNNHMHGTVPPSFESFEQLTHLDLHNNDFTGMIPWEWEAMTQLTYLHLGQNDWTTSKEMPHLLDKLTNLRELSLTNSSLTGTIPSWLGNWLKELEYIDLSHNQLTKSIPSNLMHLANLDFLLLHNNILTGEIPDGGEFFTIFSVHQNSGLTGDLNFLCTDHPDNREDGFFLVAADCSMTCDKSCCPTCCPVDGAKELCFQDELESHLKGAEGMWEFGYERPPFDFDPYNLDEVGLFNVLRVEEDNNEDEKEEP